MGPGTHEYPGLRSYIARVMLRRQDGQIIPGLVMMMISLIVFGMLFFQIGRAAVFSTEAQTGADAVALAGARTSRRSSCASSPRPAWPTSPPSTTSRWCAATLYCQRANHGVREGHS